MNYLNLNCPPLPYYLAGGKSTYDINEEFQTRKEKSFTLVYVKQGKLLLEQESITAQLYAGDYFITTPNTSFSGLGPCTEKTVLFWINFASSLSYSLSDTGTAYALQNMADDHSTAPQLFVISVARHRTIEKHNRPYLEELFQSIFSSSCYFRKRKGGCVADHIRLFDRQVCFIQLLSLLNSQQFSPKQKFNAAEMLHDYIDQHYVEGFRLGEIANLYSYNPSHLIRCFSDTYGLSPMQYVKKLRILRAKKLLDETNLPIQVVGNESGFKICSYFIRQFKKEFGVTPAKYRANLSRDEEQPT